MILIPISGYEITPDKYYHAGGSFLLCGAGMLVVNDNITRYAIMPVMVFGIGYMKECTDDFYSSDDMIANATGILTAIIFDYTMRKVIFKK